ncbi:MarR family transcriptional regulator [Solihabitans fulvus]|uniref:MarR family transcriptional regulator n=1 Tax=Solihabitans fulvus TaxID=1892852 RepID=A0A5B2WIX6_9PSEU|nr:MarR family transcriptional regulator [Solihabitans fulvus]KAA2251365.1 MarR family transcriptional regulator [Solihabitans fulvus]
MTEPRWLNEDEQQVWRSLVLGSARLLENVDRHLRNTHDLTLAEYEVLVRLSEAPERRVRMAALAESASHSRSRLSHTVGRLERDGLVRRESCPGDKRGVFAVLTDDGMRKLATAAVDHVTEVRRLVFDPADFADLTAAARALGSLPN